MTGWLGRGKVRGKDLCAPLEMGWERERRKQWVGFPATELGGGGNWISGAVGEVYLQPTCCPRRSSPLISRRCLLVLESGPKQQAGEEGWKVGRLEDLWDPQEMRVGQGGLPKMFCCRARDQTGILIWGKRARGAGLQRVYQVFC